MKQLMIMFAIVMATTVRADDSLDEFGGEITLWPKDPGLFLFIDAQSRVKGDPIENPIGYITSEFSIDIRRVAAGAAFDIGKVQAELKSRGAKGCIWIVDDPALPVTLVAPEDGWGLVNVAPLFADSPDEAKLNARLSKFLIRTFANLHGVGDPVMMPGCVMKPAVGIVGVDELVCSTFSPESHAKVSSFLAKAGFKARKHGTYYDACEAGWAPAPTNEVQKKIWDLVHQLPTKPMTIRRESERKKAK